MYFLCRSKHFLSYFLSFLISALIKLSFLTIQVHLDEVEKRLVILKVNLFCLLPFKKKMLLLIFALWMNTYKGLGMLYIHFYNYVLILNCWNIGKSFSSFKNYLCFHFDELEVRFVLFFFWYTGGTLVGLWAYNEKPVHTVMK